LASIATLSGTGIIYTNATTTNLNFTNATGSLANISTVLGTNQTFTNGTTTNFNATNATTTNLAGTGSIFTNGTTTNFNFTNATGSLAAITTLSGTGLIYTNATTTNLNFTNATGTLATITTVNGTNHTFTNGTTTNLNFTTATGTSLALTNLISTNATTTNLNFTNATGSLAVITTLSGTGFTFTNGTTTNLNFTNATGSLAAITTLSGTGLIYTNATTTNLNFTTATGTNLTVSNFTASTLATLGNSSFTNATGSVLSLTASGTPALYITGTPQRLATTSLVRLGPFDLVGGSATGTYIGLNTPAFQGDFLNLQVNSSTQFRVDNAGGLVFGNATGTSLNLTGLIATNATTTNLNFTNATGTLAALTTVNGTNHTFTNGTSTNFNFTTATGTSLTLTGLIATNATTTNLNFTNATGTLAALTTVNGTGLTFTNATTTNLNFTNATGSLAVITTLSGTGIIYTNATTTNLNFTNATGSLAVITTLSGTGFTFTNGTTTNFNATNATTTNLAGTGFIFTNATTTNLNFTNATGSLAAITTLSGTGLIYTNATTTNLNFTNATGTLATITTVNGTNHTFTNGTSTNFNFTIATGTSLALTNLISTNATTTNLNSTTATTSQLAITGVTGTQCLHVTGNGVVSGSGADCGGTGSNPASTGGAIQFNNGGVFGGDATNFSWSTTTQAFRVNATTSFIGNVGFGTSTPTNTLYVFASGSIGGITLDGATNPALTFKASGTIRGFIGIPTIQDGYSLGATSTDLVIRTESGKILFSNDAGASTVMTIATSSVTISGAGGLIAKGPIANVKAFGARGDGTIDDAAAIQSAINSLPLGGEVYFPAGQYNINSSLSIATSSIHLTGAGSFGNADVGSTFNGARLAWGSATASSMISIAPVAGASNQALKDVEISNLSMDCGGLAGFGLQIKSVHFSVFRNLYIKNCVTAAIDTNVVATLGEARDVTKNIFETISIRELDGAASSSIGIRLDGDSSANTSLNTFTNVSVLHQNGIGVKILNADSNRFYSLTINRASGIYQNAVGVELNGSTTVNGTARSNAFYMLEAGTGGLAQRSTGQNFAADKNWISLYSTENGAPPPIAEGTSTLYYNTQLYWGSMAPILNTTSTNPLVPLFQISAGSSTPQVDFVTINNTTSTGVTTTGVSALQISYYGGAANVEASAERIDFSPNPNDGGTWNGLRIVASSTKGTTTTINGIKFDNIVPGTGTETALQFGTGWDQSIQWLNPTSSLRIVNSTGTIWRIVNGSTTLMELKTMGNNAHPFGAAVTAGAFIDRNSYFGEEYILVRPGNCTASSVQARGSFGSPGTTACAPNSGELSLATLVSGGTITAVTSTQGTTNLNGIERFRLTGAGGASFAAANEYIGVPAATGTAALNFAASNLPVITAKFNMGSVANDRPIIGISDMIGATSTVPNNGIFFSVCNNAACTSTSTSLVGWIKNGASISTTSCSAAGTLTANNWNYVRIEVRNTTSSDVRFFADTNVANGITETDCGIPPGNIATPTGGLSMTANFSTFVAATNNFDLDYYRVWQDDNVPSSNPPPASQSAATDTPATTTLNMTDLAGVSSFAEFFTTDKEIPAGSLVSLDPNSSEAKAQPSSMSYDSNLLGVVVGDPGMVLGNGNFKSIRVATHGRAIVNVSAANGPIRVGDYLTSSDIPGVAVRAGKSGPIIGQAVTGFDGNSIGSVVIAVKSSWFGGRDIMDTFSTSTLGITAANDANGYGQAILAKLLESTSTLSAARSSIYTDALVAGTEIITPLLTADGLRVDHVSANNKTISFKDAVEFIGRPYFNNDMGGFAVVKSGAYTVDVAFGEEYLAQPVVNATISLESEGGEDTIFGQGIQYLVTKKSTKGFTIRLNKPAPQDIRFSWSALAIKNARTSISADGSSAPTTSSPPETPAPEVAGTSTATSSETSSSPPASSTEIVPEPAVSSSETGIAPAGIGGVQPPDALPPPQNQAETPPAAQ
jgi:hypothetical protein